MNESQIAIIQQLYGEWVGGDYSNGALLHPDYELVFAPGFLDEGAHSGWKAAWQGWKEWLDQWESWDYHPIEYIDAGPDRIGVLVDIDGVAKSTGMPLAIKSANLWEFEDGLVRRLTLFAHREDMMRVLGTDAP